jgi:hypothetical protein
MGMNDWRIRDSSGDEHKSWRSAVEAYERDPTLTFTEHVLSMAGDEQRDVTAEVKARRA